LIRLRNRILAFLFWLLAVSVLFGRTLARLFEDSLHAEYTSHVVLIPFIIGYLLWSSGEKIFANPAYSWKPGFLCAVTGAIVYSSTKFSAVIGTDLAPTLVILSALLLVVAGFLTCFGGKAFRAALFPILMLAFLLPIPSALLNKVITGLQVGSAQLSTAMFSLLGVPVYREGVILTLPGATIEVARECSGINSTVALLITILLAAHETLRRGSSRLIFVIVALPLSIIKNSIRIVTLVLLATHVDPGFLTGRLHHQGGIVFFLISLALMYPVWKLLHLSEKRAQEKTISKQLREFKASAAGHP
jgi:exosortase